MSNERVAKIKKVDDEIMNGILGILKITSPNIDQTNARKYLHSHISVTRHVFDFIDDYLKWKAQKLSYPRLVHHVDLLVYNVQTALAEELQNNAPPDQTDD